MSVERMTITVCLLSIALGALAIGVLNIAQASPDDVSREGMYRVSVAGVYRDGATLTVPSPTPTPTSTPEPTPVWTPEPTPVWTPEPTPVWTPEPTATPGQIVSGWGPETWPLDTEEIMAAARAAGWPEWTLPTVARIALCESGGNPAIVSYDGMNLGLMQINRVHEARLAGRDWSDPVVNLSVALEIFNESGGSFTPWACY